jgi:hypothetical protein
MMDSQRHSYLPSSGLGTFESGTREQADHAPLIEGPSLRQERVIPAMIDCYIQVDELCPPPLYLLTSIVHTLLSILS